jgi:serine/threonine protein kinase
LLFSKSIKLIILQDGDIGRKIREKKEQKQLFDEETIFMWSQEMIFGIYFLHCHSIIHRDIKPG